MSPNIVVIGGGPSAEREISIRSAQAVYEALKDYPQVSLQIIDRELPGHLQPQRDILFLTTHGTFGEDGHLQEILEEKGYCYTGCNAASSRLCFHKQQTKNLAVRQGIRVAEGVTFAGHTSPEALWKLLGPKIVLKPEAEGSSIGLHIIDSLAQLKAILPQLGSQAYLAERYIPGRELTIGILGEQALAPVEIRPQGGLYDTAHKYTTGASQYESPAQLPHEITQQLRHAALQIYTASGCRDFARLDFRLSPANQLYFLETNTLPGLTATSLLPKSAAPFGYSYPQLIQAMLRPAQQRWAMKHATALA